MILYLTSVAAKTLDKLLPLLPSAPESLSVAFVPTAGDLYKEKPWIEEDRNKLTSMGFKVVNVDLKNKKKEELEHILGNIDIIFVAGGNTSYLLDQAQQSGFIEVVRDLVRKGKIYIGSSAGSLLAGPNIEVDKIYDDGEFNKVLNSYEGLGFVPFVVLPHADNPKYAPYLARISKEFGSKYQLKEIKDNQAIIVRNNDTEIIEI